MGPGLHCRCEIERILAERGRHSITPNSPLHPKALLPPRLPDDQLRQDQRAHTPRNLEPVRSDPGPSARRWHGPNITYFARVCCDLAKLYGALFDLTGLVEGLFSAVRWNRQGLYRSRWGNYDLIANAGYLTASRGLVAADILASRLQGQDVNSSAFFDVVQTELGWDAAASQPLPDPVKAIFA